MTRINLCKKTLRRDPHPQVIADELTHRVHQFCNQSPMSHLRIFSIHTYVERSANLPA